MSSDGGPATIYLIRHGEKLGDPGNDKDGGPHLSVRGSARAAAIPLLFTPTSVVSGSQGGAPSCSLATHGVAFAGSYVEEKLASVGNPRFSPPHAIFATNPGDSKGGDGDDKKKSISHRPLETIVPLASALNIAPDTKYTDEKYKKLATHVTAGGYAGKVVLIAWHHGTLKDLAKALGAGATDAPEWPDTTFDWLWEIDYSQNPQHVIEHWQGLLYADTAPDS